MSHLPNCCARLPLKGGNRRGGNQVVTSTISTRLPRLPLKYIKHLPIDILTSSSRGKLYGKMAFSGNRGNRVANYD